MEYSASRSQIIVIGIFIQITQVDLIRARSDLTNVRRVVRTKFDVILHPIP